MPNETAHPHGLGPHARPVAWYNPMALARGFTVRPKLYVAIAAGALAIIAAPPALPWSARAVLGWDTGGIVYIALAFYLMSGCTMEGMRRRAMREDETRFVFFTIILAAIAISFSAVVLLIGEAKSAAGMLKPAYFVLAGVAILVSWVVTQIVFTLHYAHDYHHPHRGAGAAEGGLKFPGDEVPDYWDFFYFTTSIGATSQTSDVSVTSKSLRRLVTVQAILSFVFNTTIIALAINLASGML